MGCTLCIDERFFCILGYMFRQIYIPMNLGERFGSNWHGRNTRPSKLLVYSILISIFILLTNVAIVLFIHDARLKVILFDLPYPLWALIGSAGLFYAARQSARYSQRLFFTWGILAAALLSFSAGDITWVILENILEISPFPSVADGFYLLYYPLFLIGVLRLATRPLNGREQLKTLLDMSSVMLASVLVLWNYWLGPLAMSVKDESALVQILSLAYPVGDLILLWALLMLLYRRPEGHIARPLLLLAMGVGIEIVMDGLFGYQSILGTYTSGWLDIGWLCSHLLKFIAGIWQATTVQASVAGADRPANSETSPHLNSWITYLPYIGLGGVYLLLVEGHFKALPTNFLWTALGVGSIIGFLLLRQILTLQENTLLFDQVQTILSQIRQQALELHQTNQGLASARDHALEAARLKSEFLTTMSHEIRTPMNGVIGMTELLQGTDLDAEQQEYAAIVANEADHLLHIINNILDFAKIEADKLLLDIQDFAPAHLLAKAAELTATKASAKQIALLTFIAADVPARVRGDEGRLRQILLNLVDNAIKFTEQGEVVVRLTLEAATPTHVMLRVTVTDTGIGISAADQQRLFQPFTQAAGRARQNGGAGLGLALVSRLVNLMNGSIGLESELGKGSTFWFTVCLASVPIATHYCTPASFSRLAIR